MCLNDFENNLQYLRASICAGDTKVTIVSNDIKQQINDVHQELRDSFMWMKVNTQ